MTFTVALLQMNAHRNDQKANADKGEAFCRQAALMGADLALFPEMWNIGYTPYNQESFRDGFDPTKPVYEPLINEWRKQAVPRDGEYVGRFQALAKELNMAIAVTYLEAVQGMVRNSVSILDRFGSNRMTYSKVHTCDFSFENACTPGEGFFTCTLPTAEGEVILGAMICYDREFPESARVLMLKGAEVILIPNACGIDENRNIQLRTRAYENMLGVAMANYAYPDCNGYSVAYDGIAWGKQGSRDMLLVQAGEPEGIYLAHFDLNRLREWRQTEVWGNTFRKVRTYGALLEDSVQPPFLRNLARK